MQTTARTFRYTRSWLTGKAAVREATLSVPREDGAVPARILLPADASGPHPAWIVLHGVTRMGYDHPQLLRFARALASSGTLVLVPEIPEWKDLRLSPEAAAATVRGALAALAARQEAAQGKRGVIGFSFGGPQALLASRDEAVAPHLAGVVSFGGYCDLERTVRFQFTGVHEWRGRTEHLRPDPYGRWIIGANYLPHAAGYEEATDVAGALHQLACAAGDWGKPAWIPEYDPLKARLRRTVAPERVELFDLFAPPSDREPDRERAEALVRPLSEGGRKVSPLMDPAPRLRGLRHRVELLHGRGDRLIPYTESLRARTLLPADAPARVTVTRLFAHSTEERFPMLRGMAEAWTFLRALGRVLGTV